MKISGDKLIEVYHTWLKDYFSNVRLTSSKVNWLKLPLAKNAPVSPTCSTTPKIFFVPGSNYTGYSKL